MVACILYMQEDSNMNKTNIFEISATYKFGSSDDQQRTLTDILSAFS